MPVNALALEKINAGPRPFSIASVSPMLSDFRGDVQDRTN